jgi:hypothetical protein
LDQIMAGEISSLEGGMDAGDRGLFDLESWLRGGRSGCGQSRRELDNLMVARV